MRRILISTVESYAEEYADSQGFLFVDVNKEEDVKRNSFAKRLFDVALVEAGSDRMAVIKLLKKECGMGMADAKAAMDSAPDGRHGSAVQPA